MKKIRLALLISAVSLLTSCASYQAYSLESFNERQQEKKSYWGDIEIRCRLFNQQECQCYLDRNLSKVGYEALLLVFDNKSEMSYIYDRAGVSLESIPSIEVAQRVHTSTLKRIMGYGISALYFPPLIIPAFVDGIMSSYANRSLDEDFALKSPDRLIIMPHSSVGVLLFVPSCQFKAKFELTLKNEVGEMTTIPVEVDCF